MTEIDDNDLLEVFGDHLVSSEFIHKVLQNIFEDKIQLTDKGIDNLEKHINTVLETADIVKQKSSRLQDLIMRGKISREYQDNLDFIKSPEFDIDDLKEVMFLNLAKAKEVLKQNQRMRPANTA